jgi:serine/threonine protein kinase
MAIDILSFSSDGPIIDAKLHEQVKPLDEETARDYLVQIMLGIEYLHHNDIVHRDIKPDNILLQNDRKTCKIVDFGVSEMFTKPGDDTLNKSAGSPAFMSPELCTARHGDFHGKYSDVWSLGVTFYCMVVGRLPFDKSQFLELYEAITKEEPEYPSHLSKNCKHLLQRLMEKDPKKRITLAEMRQDPFVTREGKAHIMSEKENTSSVVVEVTDEEVDGAIKKISSVFTLARAISKFKRAGSRASSTSSIGEMTGQWIQKGKDMAGMPEGEHDDDDVKEMSVEHLAAAHLAIGAHAAKGVAKRVLDKGQSMISSPEQDGSQEEERNKGPPQKEDKSYFTESDSKEEQGKEEDSASKTIEEVKEEEGLLGEPQVSSPMAEDLPNPKDAAPAYSGHSAKEKEEEEQRIKEEEAKDEAKKEEQEK